MTAGFSSQEIAEIRKQVVEFQSQVNGKSYPDELRDRILTLAEAIGGMNASRKTGVSFQSIYKWSVKFNRRISLNHASDQACSNIQVTRISPESGLIRQDAMQTTPVSKPVCVASASVAGVHFEFHDVHTLSQIISKLTQLT